MPKKSKKSLSKRMTLRKKYKIIKKVKEHHRKARKAAKKLGLGANRKKNPLKDPGVPNDLPVSMKSEFMKEMDFERLRMMARNKARKAVEVPPELESLLKGGAKTTVMDTDDKMGQLQMLANAQEHEFQQRMDAVQKESDSFGMKGVDNSRRAFYREFKKVVELSDVVLQVLDARDPMACRCLDVESYVRSVNPNKKIVLLLNKIDLIPSEVCEQWLKYFRQEIPCIAFKCSTQKQATNLGHRSSTIGNKSVGECLGGDTLLKLLKNYTRSGDIKRNITVGVVGIPNVGKSSLINSLKRARVASVGNKPGVTRNVQEIELDKHVTLLDSPGIVFQDGAGAVLRNAVAIDRMDDPVTPVYKILEKVGKKSLMKMYKVSNFEDADGFLRNVAAVRGKLKRGGTPDVPAAARIVLQDWNDGRLQYYTLPPQRQKPLSSKIVSDYGADFDIDAVYAEEKSTVIAGLPSLDDDNQQFVEVAPNEPTRMAIQMEEDDADEMQQEGIQNQPIKVSNKSQYSQLYGEIGQYNPLKARAMKKKRRKQNETDMDIEQEDFDFAVDWNQGAENATPPIAAHNNAFEKLVEVDDDAEQMQE